MADLDTYEAEPRNYEGTSSPAHDLNDSVQAIISRRSYWRRSLYASPIATYALAC